MSQKETQIEEEQKKNKLPMRIILAVLICLGAMLIFCQIMDVKPTVFYPIKGDMTADVTYENGETVHFEDGNFGIANLGDEVRLHVTFPESYGIKAAELFVPMHNVVLNVKLENMGYLYRDNINMSDVYKHYGNRIYEVQLPGGFETKELELEIKPTSRMAYSDLDKAGIIPANEGWKQIISGHSLSFLLFITVMVMAVICICYFGIKSLEEKKLQLGLSLAIFELVICGWFFGSLSMFYLFVEDISFCAKIEYYSLYLSPIPMTVFVYQVVDKKVMKRLVALTGTLYTLFYIVSTMIERMPGKGNYSHMLPGMHILTGMTMICLVVAIFGGIRSSVNPYAYILRFGILVTMFCGLAELLRFNIVKYVLDASWATTKGLSGLAILAVAISLVVYLISYSTSEFAVRIEQQQLLKLAYQDALTGMPNRADCYRNIEKMEKKNIREYTMVFIDLNNLKMANDRWGHDMGDRLLKATANEIMTAFSGEGFVSRWGGDEFVACVFGGKEKALEKVKDFEGKMRVWDASGAFPMEVSAACGWACSQEEAYVTPIEAIRLADEEMYEKKRKMKNVYGSAGSDGAS